jgi:hypothetical protein
MLEARNAVRFDEGLRAIAGASDAGASSTPSPGHVLVHRRFAEASAKALLSNSKAMTPPAMLADIDLSREPTSDEVALLVLRIRSRRVEPESSTVGALIGLWREVAAASSSNEDAWSALLTALFGDPDLAIY